MIPIKDIPSPETDAMQIQEQRPANAIEDGGKLITNSLNIDMFNEIVAKAAAEPTEDEKQRLEKMAKIEECRMDFSNPVQPEEYLLEIDGHGFFAKGDVHGIKAKQKSGKTTVITVMVAAILNGECFRVKCRKEGVRVIWFDTEQKKSDTFNIYNKVFELAGIEKHDMHDRFELYSLRRMTMEEKMESLSLLISEKHPDIVFVDGIVDLVKNFNEVEDSQNVMNQLLVMSAEHECAIVCVLHTNKDVTDHNMRGHLGTMLSQRAGNVFECQKDKGVITVSCSESRHGDVPAWSIMYDQDGNIVDADAYHDVMMQQRRYNAEQRRAEEQAVRMRQRSDVVVDLLKCNNGSLSKNELREQAMQKLDVKDTTINEVLKGLFTKEVIFAEGKQVFLNSKNETNL